MSNKLLLLGGGGHCHSVLDSIIATNQFDKIGIIDSVESSYLGISVIGTDNDIPILIKDGWNCAMITIGGVGNTEVRRRLFAMLRRFGICTPSVIDPTAIIAKGSVIKDGCYVGKRSVVNTGVYLDECCIVNTGAIIEHDCKIGAFAHISPGTTLCGYVKVGSDAHIGAGSIVRQQITIGDRTLIGAGSVVVKDMPDNVKAYGNPCRVVK